MKGWWLALLLKPLIGLSIAAAYYVFIIGGLKWLYPRLPKNRVVDFLFKERGDRKPDYGPVSSDQPPPTLRAILAPPSQSGRE